MKRRYVQKMLNKQYKKINTPHIKCETKKSNAHHWYIFATDRGL
jgi:hypothetical protein